jgi:hypothetical protein
MNPFTRQMVCVLSLTALAATGCAGEPDENEDISAGDPEAGEEPDAIAESAEQPLTINGCYFKAFARVDGRWVVGSGYFNCEPRRTVTVGVCIDKFEGIWVRATCSGARKMSAWSPIVVDTWGRGSYRVRMRIEGYGTSYAYAKVD